MLTSINPYDNSFIKEYEEYSDSTIENILEKTDSAFQDWKNTSFENRKKLMLNAAELLRKNKERYAKMMTLEMGKIISESRAEVEKSAWVCEYYAQEAEGFLQDELIESDAGKSFVAFEPLGIILAVMPWNFPFWQVLRFAAPALMAGNACVLKHASNVQGSALLIEELFRDAGFPEDIFRTLVISSSKVEAVLRDDRIKAVTLTGSDAAGSKVASIAGSEIKKSVMELGGSDPFIVLEDADIPACVLTAKTARMINAGQSCIAAKRFIVVESRLKEFEERQVLIMSQMRMGNPLDEQTHIGPLARMDLMEELHQQVAKSVDMGAKILLGGKIPQGAGAFYPPTILTDVKKGMPVYGEETFGPVTAIIPVKDEDEAIYVANDSIYGLAGSLWTRDVKKGEALARKIQSGAIFVNGMSKSDPRLPFGGVKKSGFGRELSYYGIKEFVNIKTIWIA